MNLWHFCIPCNYNAPPLFFVFSHQSLFFSYACLVFELGVANFFFIYIHTILRGGGSHHSISPGLLPLQACMIILDVLVNFLLAICMFMEA
jgi:hypothetical protein